MRPNIRDLTGQRFGRLVVLGLEPGSVSAPRRRHLLWRCQCDCGTVTLSRGDALTSGRTKSCKCLNRDLFISNVLPAQLKHGDARKGAESKEYDAWIHAKQRCLNPRNAAFDNYGGRGIEICQRWIDSFENFLEDMGRCPPGLTLDRWPNNDGNYEPGNCRWATRLQQAQNRRARKDSTAISFEGRTQTLAQWVRETGISAPTISRRLKDNWPADILFKPPKTTLTFSGRTMSVSEWATALNRNINTLRRRIWLGWSVDRILAPSRPCIRRS